VRLGPSPRPITRIPAAAVYFISASLLVCTIVGVILGRYLSDIKLAYCRSTLMFQVILSLGNLLAAATIYGRIENADYLDAFYDVGMTLVTIGYCDFSPKTHVGRVLSFPMAIGGIPFVGLTVASLSFFVLDRGCTKVSIRMAGKATQKALTSLGPKTGAVGPYPLRKTKPASTEASELDRREQASMLCARHSHSCHL